MTKAIVIPDAVVLAAKLLWSEKHSPSDKVNELTVKLHGVFEGYSRGVIAVASLMTLLHMVDDCEKEARALQALAYIASLAGLHCDDPNIAVDLADITPQGTS